nr:hypothetical protein [Paenibacillus xylanexedens]
MKRRIKSFWRANNFLVRSYKNYIAFSSPSEKIFDVLFPFIIATALVTGVYFFNNISVKEFIDKFNSLNGTIISAISILVGFNFAGVSIIASSQSELVSYLKSRKSKRDNKTTLFKVLMIFFTWSIVIELLIVTIGVVLYFFSQFFVPSAILKTMVPLYVWVAVLILVFLVLHALFNSVRNIKMLFYFITKDYTKPPEDVSGDDDDS